MKIFIDTNVILDIFQKREPFFSDSYNAIKKAIASDVQCLVSASAATDIFYIIRKSTKSVDVAKKALEIISQITTIADVQGIDIHTALRKPMGDFEDAVVDTVAERYKARYILTRNTKDYYKSAVMAITPKEFLELFTIM